MFITLPKKSGVSEYEFHRTIILTGYITKRIIRILMNRYRKNLYKTLEQTLLYSFKNAGNTKWLMQNNIYFIDYTKVFDKIHHQELHMLEKLLFTRKVYKNILLSVLRAN